MTAFLTREPFDAFSIPNLELDTVGGAARQPGSRRLTPWVRHRMLALDQTGRW